MPLRVACFLAPFSLANSRFQRFLSDFIGRLLVNNRLKNKCRFASLVFQT